MLKLFLQNTTKLLAAFSFLSFQLALGQTNETQKSYYRVANITQLGTGQLDVYYGDKALASQTNSGFYMDYSPFEPKAGSALILKAGDKQLGSARLPETKSAQFFTILITSEESVPKLSILDDTIPHKTDEMTGEKIPLKRLRVFASPYQIPIKAEAGELLSWSSKTGSDPLRVEKIVEKTNANTIKVTFLDDQNMPVDLYFPLDFNTNRANSVFISQRGPQRLRVVSYPDAVEPFDENDETDESATQE
jgi:hypothetical protein